jgi:hypothetical protein
MDYPEVKTTRSELKRETDFNPDAELGTAAPDIIFLKIFWTPELHNIYVAQYISIYRYYRYHFLKYVRVRLGFRLG